MYKEDISKIDLRNSTRNWHGDAIKNSYLLSCLFRHFMPCSLNKMVFRVVHIYMKLDCSARQKNYPPQCLGGGYTSHLNMVTDAESRFNNRNSVSTYWTLDQAYSLYTTPDRRSDARKLTFYVLKKVQICFKLTTQPLQEVSINKRIRRSIDIDWLTPSCQTSLPFKSNGSFTSLTNHVTNYPTSRHPVQSRTEQPHEQELKRYVGPMLGEVT